MKAGKTKRDFSEISLIFVLFLLSRLLFIFFTPLSNYCEEAKIGSLGHDFLFEEGLKLPFWCYMDSPHAGGSIFSGLVAIPFYWIVGDRYLALKIPALIFSFLTILLWYKLLDKEMGRETRIFFPFLFFFVFSTPHFLQKSVIWEGNCVELMFFYILTTYYFWKYIFCETKAVPLKRFFLLGWLMGFTCWIQFIGFYHRRVVDEYGCVMDDFPIARFLCRKKGNPPRGSHRTFSVLPLELIPYTKYSIVFIFKVLRLLYISRMSVMELQTLLSRALCGDIQYIDLSTYAVGAFKKLLREAILKFFSLGFYTGREHELSSVDPPHRAVRLIEFALDFETFKTTPPIRGPTALDYDFYLQGGGYMQNAYFLMGSPSQFR